MDFLCPEIERLVSCYTCGRQALPPYQLCVEAHVSCPQCTKYQPRCACGCCFLRRPNTTLDWLMSVMKFKCKYRANQSSALAPGQADCSNGWYTVQELCDHYRTDCSRNLFTCPLQNCGHVGRVDTITEHYDTAHGPFPPLSADDYQQPPNCVMFKLPVYLKKQTDIVRKIFNGYFLFSVKPQRRRLRDNNMPLSMQNINPSDRFRYTYTATIESKMITVTVTLVETYRLNA